MGVTEQKFSRSAAVHEAGHAIVAWSFGLPLGAMWIDAGDSGGETQIGCSDRLTLAEQIAVRCAGGIAQAIFECPGNEVATFKDNFEVMKLSEVHGYTEQSGALAVRCQGCKIAEAILEANRKKTLALADQLVECGRIGACDVLRLIKG
jgi:hypothetical protein